MFRGYRNSLASHPHTCSAFGLSQSLCLISAYSSSKFCVMSVALRGLTVHGTVEGCASVASQKRPGTQRAGLPFLAPVPEGMPVSEKLVSELLSYRGRKASQRGRERNVNKQEDQEGGGKQDKREVGAALHMKACAMLCLVRLCYQACRAGLARRFASVLSQWLTPWLAPPLYTCVGRALGCRV
jgi:hypothetical protein